MATSTAPTPNCTRRTRCGRNRPGRRCGSDFTRLAWTRPVTASEIAEMTAHGTSRPRWPLASRSAYWGSAAFLGVLRVSAVQLSTLAKATQETSGTSHHTARRSSRRKRSTVPRITNHCGMMFRRQASGLFRSKNIRKRDNAQSAVSLPQTRLCQVAVLVPVGCADPVRQFAQELRARQSSKLSLRSAETPPERRTVS